MANSTRNRLDMGPAVAAALLLLCAQAPGGEIAGVLKPPERVTSVGAVDRGTKKAFPAAWDPKTGEYRVRNLPAGAYDLILETVAGRIEGVNLRVETGEPKAKPTVLKPAELDRDEIARIAELLAKLCAERTGGKPAADGILARIRQGKLSAACLVKGKSGEEGAALVEVPLKDDEPAQIGDALLELVTLARIREQLPQDFDLVIPLAEGAPGDVSVIPAVAELRALDRAWIVDWVDKLKLFENKKRVLDMDGTGERARVLVEKLRDDDAGPTTLGVSEPTAFWRIEIFDFSKLYGGWTKDRYTVVVREQVTIRKFRTYRWMFEKRLGGIAVTADGTTTVPPYEVPDKLDPARGRTPY